MILGENCQTVICWQNYLLDLGCYIVVSLHHQTHSKMKATANTKKEFQFMMDCFIKLIRTFVDVNGMTIKEATKQATIALKNGDFERMLIQAAKQM